MKPYNQTESKKDQVRRMFDNIAPAYDRLNHILSFGFDRLWRRRATKIVAQRRPASLADIATGTGDLAIGLSRRLPQCRITAVDLSPEMLRIAEEKARRKGMESRIGWMEADAENLPFEDGSFDAATASFGVRNFENLGAGIDEMNRILRPGGMVCVMEFSMPEGKIFGTLYRVYFRRILPLIGKMVSKDGNAYHYLPGSVAEFPNKFLFLRILSSAGFANCKAKSLMAGIAYIYTGEKI